MNVFKLCLFAGAVGALLLIMPGCHDSSGGEITVTRQNFGYPGMKLPPGYAAHQAQVRAEMAAHPGTNVVKIMPRKNPASDQAVNTPQQPQPIH
jgi:hypothetical protein